MLLLCPEIYNIGKMTEIKKIIEQAWEDRSLLTDTKTLDTIRKVVELLDKGA